MPLPVLGECGDPATAIHAVQGSGRASPLVGQTVVVEAVVVGDFQGEELNGVFLQEADGDVDGDPLTSEGLFVYDLPADVDEGERVRVLGTVAEYRSLTEVHAVLGLAHCGVGAVASATDVHLPVDAVFALEALEGMRVRFPHTLTVTDNYTLGRFGSLGLSVHERLYQPTQVAAPGAAAAAVRDLNDRSRIVLDDLSTRQNPNPVPYLDADLTRRIGDRVDDLTGILSGRFGEYRVQPTVTPQLRSGNPRPRGVPDVGGNLRVAVVNLKNFFTTLDRGGAFCGPDQLPCRGADTATEFNRQRGKLLTALAQLDADIIALSEIENNRSDSLQSLVDGLDQRLGPAAYAFVDTGVIGTDAVKVAYLYRPAKVSLVGIPVVLDSDADRRFQDRKNRPSLAQTFALAGTGERITIVNNHLKSKGADCEDVGDPDVRDGQGNCNRTRTDAVEALVAWLDSDPTGGEAEHVLIVGDLNAYAMEDPIGVLRRARYEPLVETFLGPKASGFVFAGEGGYLVHALASPSLSPHVAGVAIWHTNADEPPVLDYNREFKTHDPFDGGHPFRASDHDPLVVGLQLNQPCGSAPLGALSPLSPTEGPTAVGPRTNAGPGPVGPTTPRASR